MPWLTKQPLKSEAQNKLDNYIDNLAKNFDDPNIDNNIFVREELAKIIYAKNYFDLEKELPMVAFALDPQNIRFEAEYYIATDQKKFAKVKPLLWFWKSLDQTPLGQSINTGIPIRRILAERIFAKTGKNLKIFQNVEVSVGYNIEIGSDVAIHRDVFIDDIGGVKIGNRVSLSDYVSIFSHMHDLVNEADVILKEVVIGDKVRLGFSATVLAGTVLSDNSMLGAMAVATKDLDPHVVAVGIPAKARAKKANSTTYPSVSIDAASYTKSKDIRANPDYQGRD